MKFLAVWPGRVFLKSDDPGFAQKLQSYKEHFQEDPILRATPKEYENVPRMDYFKIFEGDVVHVCT